MGQPPAGTTPRQSRMDHEEMDAITEEASWDLLVLMDQGAPRHKAIARSISISERRCGCCSLYVLGLVVGGS